MRELEIGSDGTLFTVTSAGTEAFFVPVIPKAAAQALTGAGAINVTSYYTAVTSASGPNALTLADGTVKGQLKKVQLIVDDGGAALTIASPVSSSLDVVTFADAGDFVLLLWNGDAWSIIEAGNDADGATAPAVA